MTMTASRVFAALMLGLLLVARPATADDWKLLGTRTVDRGGDRDEIHVSAVRGAFRKIKLKVEGSPVEIKSLHVVYGNGEPDKLEVRDHIHAGGETRSIDLNGGDRVIKKVIIWYKTEGGHNRAVITLWGRD
jgi:Protein of unknown function (DUF2541)